MVGEVGDEQMAIYRTTARRRRDERAEALAARQARASELARLGAERLLAFCAFLERVDTLD